MKRKYSLEDIEKIIKGHFPKKGKIGSTYEDRTSFIYEIMELGHLADDISGYEKFKSDIEEFYKNMTSPGYLAGFRDGLKRLPAKKQMKKAIDDLFVYIESGKKGLAKFQTDPKKDQTNPKERKMSQDENSKKTGQKDIIFPEVVNSPEVERAYNQLILGKNISKDNHKKETVDKENIEKKISSEKDRSFIKTMFKPVKTAAMFLTASAILAFGGEKISEELQSRGEDKSLKELVEKQERRKKIEELLFSTGTEQKSKSKSSGSDKSKLKNKKSISYRIKSTREKVSSIKPKKEISDIIKKNKSFIPDSPEKVDYDISKKEKIKEDKKKSLVSVSSLKEKEPNIGSNYVDLDPYKSEKKQKKKLSEKTSLFERALIARFSRDLEGIKRCISEAGSKEKGKELLSKLEYLELSYYIEKGNKKINGKTGRDLFLERYEEFREKYGTENSQTHFLTRERASDSFYAAKKMDSSHRVTKVMEYFSILNNVNLMAFTDSQDAALYSMHLAVEAMMKMAKNEDISEEHKDSLQYYLKFVKTNSNSKDFKEAKQRIEDIIIDYNNTQAKKQWDIAESYFSKERYTDALRHYNILVNDFPKTRGYWWGDLEESAKEKIDEIKKIQEENQEEYSSFVKSGKNNISLTGSQKQDYNLIIRNAVIGDHKKVISLFEKFSEKYNDCDSLNSLKMLYAVSLDKTGKKKKSIEIMESLKGNTHKNLDSMVIAALENPDYNPDKVLEDARWKQKKDTLGYILLGESWKTSVMNNAAHGTIDILKKGVGEGAERIAKYNLLAISSRAIESIFSEKDNQEILAAAANKIRVSEYDQEDVYETAELFRESKSYINAINYFRDMQKNKATTEEFREKAEQGIKISLEESAEYLYNKAENEEDLSKKGEMYLYIINMPFKYPELDRSNEYVKQAHFKISEHYNDAEDYKKEREVLSDIVELYSGSDDRETVSLARQRIEISKNLEAEQIIDNASKEGNKDESLSALENVAKDYKGTKYENSALFEISRIYLYNDQPKKEISYLKKVISNGCRKSSSLKFWEQSAYEKAEERLEDIADKNQ